MHVPEVNPLFAQISSGGRRWAKFQRYVKTDPGKAIV
jgi:hypothetical protein